MSVGFGLVFEDHVPHLFDLICFGFVSKRFHRRRKLRTSGILDFAESESKEGS